MPEPTSRAATGKSTDVVPRPPPVAGRGAVSPPALMVVAPPPPPPVTVTVPTMPWFSCGLQKYSYVPGSLKVNEKDPPDPPWIIPESHNPSYEVVVCGLLPLWTHVTVEPAGTVMLAASKKLSSIITVTFWPCCAPA